MRPETLAIHASQRHTDGAVAAPLHLSTTFHHGPAYEHLYEHTYIRDGNPNVDDLERRLAALDGGRAALVFASGMAAGAGLLSTLQPGSKVLFHASIYYNFLELSDRVLPQWGLQCRRIDMRDQSALLTALEDGPALVWLESPCNPTMDVLDLQAIAHAAKAAGAQVLVDSTFAPPVVQRPLDLGADYVLHSLTKFMGGHSDIQGGGLILREGGETFERLKTHRRLTGGVLAPFNAWMVARGLQTLYCRVERHSANALAVAEALERHPAVAQVRYPFLPSNPDYALACRQMAMGGGMLSFDVAADEPGTGRARAIEVASKVRLFTNATSFGGPESLMEHRASVEGPTSPTPDTLLRCSIGLEHPEDLIADLMQALD